MGHGYRWYCVHGSFEARWGKRARNWASEVAAIRRILGSTDEEVEAIFGKSRPNSLETSNKRIYNCSGWSGKNNQVGKNIMFQLMVRGGVLNNEDLQEVQLPHNSEYRCSKLWKI